MATRNLELLLVGRDVSASRALQRVSGEASRTSGMMSKLGTAMKTGLLLGAGAAATAAAASVRLAANFQQATTELVTGAGESERALGMVRRGLLDMSEQVGVSAVDLAKGLYNIESAGYHGAKGLEVLRASAKGARVGAADMATVSDAVTTALNAYNRPASDAAKVTNTLIDTVKAGKVHLQDLASSLGQVLPSAAALHVPFEQVAAAMATMTSQGTNAAKASTSLRFLFNALVAPTSGATSALKDMGLSASDLGDTLTKKGLGPALVMLTDAVGKQFPEGSAAYIAALSKIVGGTRGMQAVLELTGRHAQTFSTNVGNISGQVDKAGNSISGWAKVQQDFNFKLDRAKEQIRDVGIKLGTVLLPPLTEAVGWFSRFVDGLSHSHRHLDAAGRDGQAVGRFWKNDLVPALQGAWGAMRAIAHIASPVLDFLGKLVGHNKDVAKFAIEFGLIAGAAVKLKGLGGNLLGGLGGRALGGTVASRATPIPVYVTNMGGLPGAGGGGKGPVPVPAGKPGLFGMSSELPSGLRLLAGGAAFTGATVTDKLQSVPTLNEYTRKYVEDAAKSYAGIQSLKEDLAKLLKANRPQDAAYIEFIRQQIALFNQSKAALHAQIVAAGKDYARASSIVQSFSDGSKHSIDDYITNTGKLPASTAVAIEGLLKAIDQGKVGAQAGFRRLVNLIRTSVPPGLLTQDGKDLIEGLIQGINSKTDAVVSTLSGISAAAQQGFKRANESQSPSKVYRRLGQDLIKGLTIGIGDLSKLPVARLQGLAERMVEVLRRKKNGLSKATEDMMRGVLDQMTRSLAKFQRIQGQLQGTRQKARSFAAGITGTIVGQADLVNMQGPVGTTNIIDFLTKQRNRDQRFRHDLFTLRHKLGNSAAARALIDQLASAGAAGGGAEAHALAVQASAGQLRTIVGLEAQIRGAARGIGQARARQDYGPRIARLENVLKDIRHDLRHERHEIRIILDGKDITHAVNVENRRRKNRGGQSAA